MTTATLCAVNTGRTSVICDATTRSLSDFASRVTRKSDASEASDGAMHYHASSFAVHRIRVDAASNPRPAHR